MDAGPRRRRRVSIDRHCPSTQRIPRVGGLPTRPGAFSIRLATAVKPSLVLRFGGKGPEGRRMALFASRLAAAFLLLAVTSLLSAGRVEWAIGHQLLLGDSAHFLPRVVEQSYFGKHLTGVYIEVRCHKSSLLVLQSTLRYFVQHGVRLVVWHASSNQSYLQSLIDADPFLQRCQRERLLVLHRFEPADYGDSNITDSYNVGHWYQRLLKNISFWDSIPTEWSLTLQSDTLICKPLEFLVPYLERNSTYVGGVSGFEYYFHMGGGKNKGKVLQKAKFKPIRDVPRAHDATKFFLNGGFSLHSVPWTKECIRSPDKFPLRSPIDKYTEDAYWNLCRSHLNATHPVSELEAYSFGSDNGMTMCFDDPTSGNRMCPFGVHKPWNTPWTKEKFPGMEYKGNMTELMAHCPGLGLLKDTQGVFNETPCDVAGLDGNVTVVCQCGKSPSESSPT